MKILVINGPNINMLGIREKNIYGNSTYNDLENLIKRECEKLGVDVEIYQSNYEGDIVTKIQGALDSKVDGIVINAGAYTHTSIAILDALKAVNILAVEVHISDISKREDFRKHSYLSYYCEKTIMGKGIDGYIQAINYIKEQKS